MSDVTFPHRHSLRCSVNAHGNEVSEVEIRKPIFGDIMKTDGAAGETEKLARFVASVCEVPPSTVASMDPRDVADIMKVVLPFFEAFMELGAK